MFGNPLQVIFDKLITIEETLSFLSSEVRRSQSPPDYSKQEFAIKVGKSPSWVDGLRRAGNLKWFRRGGTVRIPHSELERLLG